MAEVTFFVFDSKERDRSVPLPNTQIRVYNSQGTEFITTGNTDDTGNLVLDLPVADYWVRFFKQGFSFSTKMLTKIVEGSNIFDIPGGNLSELPPSSADNLCRLSGYIIGAGGEPMPGVTVDFLIPIEKTMILQHRVVGSTKVSTQTDKNGRLEVELIQGVTYDAVIEGIGEPIYPFTVPNLQAARFSDTVWCSPVAASVGSLTATIAVGHEVTIPISIELSSGLKTPYIGADDKKIGPSTWATVKSDNSKVASSIFSGDSSLMISGITEGTATISIFKREETDVIRLPRDATPLAEISVVVV